MVVRLDAGPYKPPPSVAVYFLRVIGFEAADLFINRAVGPVAHLPQSAAGLGHPICLGIGGAS